MGVIQISLPDELKKLIEREVAEGKATSEAEFLIEAARKYFESQELEDELVDVAEAGIAEAEAGHYTTIASSDEGTAWLERKMAKLRERPTPDK